MKTPGPHIPLASRCLSRTDIDLFLDRRMQDERFAPVLAHLQHCPYCAEAVHGLGQLADRTVLDTLEEPFRHRTGIHTGRRAGSLARRLAALVTGGGLVAALLLPVDLPDGHVAKVPAPGQPAVMNEQAARDEVFLQENAAAEPIHLSSQPDAAPAKWEKAASGMVPMQPKEGFRLDALPAPGPVSPARYAPDIRYIEGLKVYWPAAPVAGHGGIPDVPGTHVPARYERPDAMERSDEPSAPSYRDLIVVMLAGYRRGDDEAVLAASRRILRVVPGDVNAVFYAGLSLERLHRYAGAEERLERVRRNGGEVFREEAAFHLALCKQRLGKNDESRTLLEKIAREGGFYSDRARTVLQHDR